MLSPYASLKHTIFFREVLLVLTTSFLTSFRLSTAYLLYLFFSTMPWHNHLTFGSRSATDQTSFHKATPLASMPFSLYLISRNLLRFLFLLKPINPTCMRKPITYQVNGLYRTFSLVFS